MPDDDWVSFPTPLCFGCGSPPVMVFGGGTQAFCGNEGCRVLTWNPRATVDENLEDMGHVELPQLREEP